MSKTLIVCLFIVVAGIYAQPLQNMAYNPGGRVVTCGDPNSARPPEAFDPPCYARIFEDFKSKKRVILYSPHHPYQFSRILEADPDSTIVIDFAEGLRLNQDLGLNNMLVRARLVHGDASTPIQVINYAEIGKDETSQNSQKAFGFQTFEDVSDALINLYYTTKDIVARINVDDPKDKELYCFYEAQKATSPGLMPRACRVEPPEGDKAKLDKAVADAEASAADASDKRRALADKLRIAVLEQRLAAVDTSCPNCRQLIDERLKSIQQQDDDLAKAIKQADQDGQEAKKKRDHFNDEQREFTDRDNRLQKALQIYEPEARKLTELFLSGANRTVAAQIAHRVFWVDYASLIAIAKQIQDDFDKLKDPKVDAQSKIGIRQEILARIYDIINDLKEVSEELEKYGRFMKDPATKDELKKYCPATLTSPPPFTPIIDEKSKHAYGSVALECFKESERRKFTHEVERYLVAGTISLRENRAAPGDVITIEIEARGSEAENRGAIGKFEIRVKNFGWKVSETDSVMFIKRIAVNSADAARTPALKEVRFRPAPGFNLLANYYTRGSTGLEKKDAATYAPLTDEFYQMPKASTGHLIGRAISPGFGVNASLLSYDDKGPFQLGVGPIVTLFDNRISATYGWNLMVDKRRTYWGLGFSFLRVGKDVVGYFNKKGQ